MANDLADPQMKIGNFRVTGVASPGDIVAFTNPRPGHQGHSTLKLGHRLLIYAGQESVKIGKFSEVMVGHSRFTNRKWTH